MCFMTFMVFMIVDLEWCFRILDAVFHHFGSTGRDGKGREMTREMTAPLLRL
jgi:hypothetical protein